jgi:hypothetical protein
MVVKKDEPDTDELETYVPVSIKGKWLFTETYDKSATSMITYPASLDSSTVEFKDLSVLGVSTPCNVGSGKYLFTESGGIMVNDFFNTLSACGTDEALWEGRLFGGIKESYHFALSNNDKSLRLYSSTNFDLLLIKVD